MPTFGEVPEDRRVFIVKATVEFCINVNSEMFSLVSTDTDAGNLLQLYTKHDVIVDCHGPTRKQTVQLRLPENADRDRPFIIYAPVKFLGNVY